MAAKKEYGCPKCNGVIIVERRVMSSQTSYAVKNGQFKEKFGTLVIECQNKDEKRKTTCRNVIDDLEFMTSKM